MVVLALFGISQVGADVSRGTAIDVCQWLREVCTTRILQVLIVLGGLGRVVQIDKSLFRHKPKISLERQLTK